MRDGNSGNPDEVHMALTAAKGRGSRLRDGNWNMEFRRFMARDGLKAEVPVCGMETTLRRCGVS